MKHSKSTSIRQSLVAGLIASVGLLPSISSANILKSPITVIDQVIAKKHQEIDSIRKLITSDGDSKLDLAGAFALDAKTNKPVLLQSDKYFAAVVSSYAFGDLNSDGIPDLAVAVESPALANAFGARQLRIYLGESAGSYKLFKKADSVLLRRDFNKSGEEAFNALQINSKTGSLIVSHLISNVSDAKAIQVDLKQRFVVKNGEVVLANQREIHVGIEGTRYEDQDFENASQTVKFVKQIGGPSTVFKSQLSARALTKIEDASVSHIK